MLLYVVTLVFFFFFQAEDGIRDWSVTGVQTCALPISISGWLGYAAGAAPTAPARFRPFPWAFLGDRNLPPARRPWPTHESRWSNPGSCTRKIREDGLRPYNYR